MKRKTKWLLGLAGVLLAALLAFVAAGPWLAMNGIRNVVASGDYSELWRFVDFDRLRESVRPQVQERIARGIIGHMGRSGTSETIGDVTALIADPAIDAIVSPVGVATLLHGSVLVKKVSGARAPDENMRANDPLKDARARYESPSLFTATVLNDGGQPVVFEFRRYGLAWKLSGIRLPE